MTSFISRIHIPLARISIFLIYFWFGILKVLGESPATPLVKALFDETIAKMFASISISEFVIIFGIFEMIIGLLFLIPRWEKIAFPLLILHLIMTTLPLYMLKSLVWQKSFSPSLEGQYIIKNILILSTAITVWVHKRI